VASAQDTVQLLPSPLELPTRLGPLHFDGKPHKYEPAALGSSYQYNGAGVSLTIYVYDAGVANIPDGGDTVVNCHLFEQTKREIGAAGYADVRLVSEQLARLSPPHDTPLAREAVFEFVRDGQPTLSYLWMTGVARHFLKIRFSLDPNQREEAEVARRFLLTELGEAVKPHLAPIEPDAKNPEVTLNVVAGGDTEEMAAGIMYLAMLDTQLKAAPESKPLCGGEFVPPYEAELSVFKSLLALNLESTAGTLGKQLAEVSKAGFLDEFVWVELHRESWGSAAREELALRKYQAWRKKNLKGFKRPQLGSLVINSPRPMKIEASEGP
jgi:hypothetical protein